MYQSVYTQRLAGMIQLYDAEYQANALDIFQPETQKSQVFALSQLRREGLVVEDDINASDPGCTSPTVTANSSQQTDEGECRSLVNSIQLPSIPFDSIVLPRRQTCKILESVEQVHEDAERASELSIYHIRQEISFGPLLVSREVFEELIRAHSVFPAFKDMVVYMGRRNLEVEVAPPRFQMNVLGNDSNVSTHRSFECTYSVRYMQRHGRHGTASPWSLRQFTVYHQTQSSLPFSKWIFVSLPVFLQAVFHNYTEQHDPSRPENPLDGHLLLLKKATCTWRPYLVDLAKSVEDHATSLLLKCPTDPVSSSGFEQRQQLKQLEDDTLDALLALCATQDTVSSLLKMQVRTSKQPPSPCEEWRTSTTSDLSGILDDLALLQLQVKSLGDKIRGTSEAVANYLDLVNGYSLERIAKDSTRDAATVKILTIIALVYLPTTTVLNFFSTSFVSNRVGTKDSSALVVAPNWWLSLATSIPLTVLTLGAWLFWVRIKLKKEDARAQKLDRNSMAVNRKQTPNKEEV